MRKHFYAIAICATTLCATAETTVIKEHVAPNGDINRVVIDETGHAYRQYIRKSDNTAATHTQAPVIPAEEKVERTFYEGFEGYQESFGLNWIPEDWSKINTEANTPTEEQLSHNINNSWYVYFTSNMYQDLTTDGEKEAFIHFAYDGNYGVTDSEQDEWLVTPVISLGKDETLHFLLQSDYAEIYDYDYYDYDTDSYTERIIFSNMLVMITTDGGENWECVWNLEADVLSGLSDTDCFYDSGIRLRSYSVSLADYEGKDVKLAFRYMRKQGWGGNSMIVDAVVVDHPEAAGITAVEADSETAPEYFNLQGMRVSNPAAGATYIRRTGTKVEKVFVK